MSALTSTGSRARRETRATYTPLGAARRLFHSQAPEVVLSGPAGTGKSFACLHKLHALCGQVPGIRVLVLRKTLSSLTASGLVTYTERVLHPLDGVRFFGGNAQKPPHYIYPSGAVIVVGGLDKPSRVMSAEYDVIYVQEATELRESEWEPLTSRLRHNVLPYQQLLGDCNPDAPTHWLKRRADRGMTLMLESRHEDNPTVTPEYLAKLDALTGVRKERLRYGRWAAAEGIVYDGWDPAVHLVDAFPIPRDWPRYWAVDFGFTHAFVWQAWARDPDGRLYRYREIYRTKRLVEDHARDILARTGGEPRPVAVVCDHDAEDRATLEKHLGMRTTPAHKAVSPGIQAVASRLKPAGDGRPRLYFLRDALTERDPELDDAALPCCTEEELDGYVWDLSMGRKKGEEPVKERDHGADATRYLVAHIDPLGPSGAGYLDAIRRRQALAGGPARHDPAPAGPAPRGHALRPD